MSTQDLELDWDGEETFARLESLAGVEAKEVEWLWPGRIAAGCLTLVAGEEGVGKSMVTLDLAARVSRGGNWPDGQGDGIAGGVLLVTAENNREYSVVPTLEGAGADLEMIRVWSETLVKRRSKVANMRVTSSRPVNLATDLELLARMIEDTPDCRLVVIDPITSFLGRNSSELMNSLMALAERTRVAIVGVTHLKGGGQEAIGRVVGGRVLTTAARATWLVTPAAREEKGESREEKVENRGGRRLLLPIKNNLTQERSGLGFVLVRHAGMKGTQVEWSSAAIETTADTTLHQLRRRPGPDPIECELAEEFLREALADGGRPVKDVEEEGREVHGLRLDTLRRARKNLKVQAYRPVVPGPWWIRLKEEDGGRRTEVGGQESGVRGQESGVRGQESGISEDGPCQRASGMTLNRAELQDLQCLGERAGDLQELRGDESHALADLAGGIAANLGEVRQVVSTVQSENAGAKAEMDVARRQEGMSWKQRKKMKLMMKQQKNRRDPSKNPAGL